jgi:hypothetical protein
MCLVCLGARPAEEFVYFTVECRNVLWLAARYQVLSTATSWLMNETRERSIPVNAPGSDVQKFIIFPNTFLEAL